MCSLERFTVSKPILRTHIKMNKFKTDILHHLLRLYVRSLAVSETNKESTDSESGVETENMEIDSEINNKEVRNIDPNQNKNLKSLSKSLFLFVCCITITQLLITKWAGRKMFPEPTVISSTIRQRTPVIERKRKCKANFSCSKISTTYPI